MHKGKLSPAVAVAWDPGADAPARAAFLARSCRDRGVFPLCLLWFPPVKPLLIILASSCLRPEGKALPKAL